MKYSIDAREKELNAEESIILYYFSKFQDDEVNIEEFKSFVPSQTLIQKFNKKLSSWKHKFDSDYTLRRPINLDIDAPKSESFINNLNDAHAFEEFIYDEFKKLNINIEHNFDKTALTKENKFNIEIKNDKRACETGNLYIEYEEKKDINSPWRTSSLLLSPECKYWIVGDIDNYYVLDHAKLVVLYQNFDKISANFKGNGLRRAGNPTSKGMLIPIEYAMENSICLCTSVEQLVKLDRDYFIST